MMETPLTNHITKEDFECVYEPAEDSFLLLDAIEADLKHIENSKPKLCVEIGSGSGIIITALSKKLGNSSFCLALDINPKACKITSKTAQHNRVIIDVLQMDLTSCLRENTVDILIFNPPYVPTDPDDKVEYAKFSDKNIVHSWAGGLNGCKVIYRLLNNINHILSSTGVFYLLLLKENKPHKIIDKLKEYNLNGSVIMERRIPGEYLYVLKITK